MILKSSNTFKKIKCYVSEKSKVISVKNTQTRSDTLSNMIQERPITYNASKFQLETKKA